MPPLSRREILRAGLALAGGVGALGGGALVSACGSHGSTAGGGANGVSNAPPRRGGRLVIGTEAEVNGIDPTADGFDSTGVMYARAFYDPLAATDVNGKTVPYLAEAITPNADFTSWTITARSGVVFHDGVPFDADAIIANFRAHLASFVTKTALQGVSDVVKVDAMNVRIDMSGPWVPFDTYLCGWIGGQFAYMASPSALAAKTLSAHPVGTGPFVFSEWQPEDHLTGTANPRYWRSGVPYVDSVEFRPIVEAQSRVNSLKSGSIDVMHATSTSAYLDLRSTSGISIVSNLNGEFGEPDMDFIMLNTARPPLDDLRIRQALAASIDLDEYNKLANNGLLKIDRSVFQQGSASYSTANYPTYDLARAKALVAQYSAEKGGPVTIDVGNTNTQENLNDMGIVAEMWQEAGFHVNQEQIEQSVYISNALLGNYSAYFWRQFGSTDPDQNLDWWSGSTVQPDGTISLNFARNRDPEIDRALATGRTDPDPTQRADAYRTVAERLNADVPYLWQNRALWFVAAGPAVRNFNTWTLPNGAPGLGMKLGVFPIVNAWLER